MSSDTPVGLYLHVPMCIRKCNYCDFYSVAPFSSALADAYTEAICKEIDSYSGAEAKITANTVFFGGGTPSLLGPARIGRIMDAIDRSFHITHDCEVTMEMNPVTSDGDRLCLYRTAGINRLSIGIQSLCDSELAVLGRLHTAEQAVRCFWEARHAGFENINTDIIYAVPGQTKESFMKTLQGIISLCPEHISAYSLIIEPGTPFYTARDTLQLPGEEAECEMYDEMICCLRQAGYEHYEISNYAVPGRLCRHNMKYWTDMPYIGLGPAAHSRVSNIRYDNVSDINAYLNNPTGQRETEQILSEKDKAQEYVMLGLRTSRGISADTYREMVARKLLPEKEDAVTGFSEMGLLLCRDGRIMLTEHGFYLSNSIIGELL